MKCIVCSHREALPYYVTCGTSICQEADALWTSIKRMRPCKARDKRLVKHDAMREDAMQEARREVKP